MKNYAILCAAISFVVAACGSDTSESSQGALPSANQKAASTFEKEQSASDQAFAEEYSIEVARTISSGGIQGIISDEEWVCYIDNLIADIGIDRLENRMITPYEVSSSDSSSELTVEETKASYSAMKNCIDPRKYFEAGFVWDGIERKEAECLGKNFNKDDINKVVETLIELDSSSDGSRQSRDTAFSWYVEKSERAAKNCDVDISNL